jgi:hypothetical protein
MILVMHKATNVYVKHVQGFVQIAKLILIEIWRINET